LFQDRYVCVAWHGNPEIGDTLTRDEFCRIPQFGNVPGQAAVELGGQDQDVGLAALDDLLEALEEIPCLVTPQPYPPPGGRCRAVSP